LNGDVDKRHFIRGEVIQTKKKKFESEHGMTNVLFLREG